MIPSAFAEGLVKLPNQVIFLIHIVGFIRDKKMSEEVRVTDNIDVISLELHGSYQTAIAGREKQQ